MIGRLHVLQNIMDKILPRQFSRSVSEHGKSSAEQRNNQDADASDSVFDEDALYQPSISSADNYQKFLQLVHTGSASDEDGGVSPTDNKQVFTGVFLQDIKLCILIVKHLFYIF